MLESRRITHSLSEFALQIRHLTPKSGGSILSGVTGGILPAIEHNHVGSIRITIKNSTQIQIRPATITYSKTQASTSQSHITITVNTGNETGVHQALPDQLVERFQSLPCTEP